MFLTNQLSRAQLYGQGQQLKTNIRVLDALKY